MLKQSLIICAPPGSTARDHNGDEKPLLGIYPCLDDNCGQYVLVKKRKDGRPYGTCSPKEITFKGCCANAVGAILSSDFEQTHNAYTASAEQIGKTFPIPKEHSLYMENLWAQFNDAEAQDDSSD